MAWVAVDKDGTEKISSSIPCMNEDGNWIDEHFTGFHEHDFAIDLPKGSIEKLIGHPLTWEDEPVEIK